ncbi:hypothetical protein ACFOWX_03495 [Sphingorhabdus arenilitoris]|uniref:DUF3784 domain-containing protein n=1 Tax=Sphingorhabdus arenilitoris TaxID=1490041 RepID=A0ABV8RDY6_9SPHN
MPLIIAFLLGIANFAMQKAVSESGHPFVEDSKIHFGKYFGKNSSYYLEYAILVGVMYFAVGGSWLAVGIYLVYSAINALAAWVLLTGRV